MENQFPKEEDMLDPREWKVDDRGNVIHKTVVFGPDVSYGNDNYFGPYSVIGMAGEVASNNGKNGSVRIGDSNRIEGMITIDASVNDSATTIGSGCFIMKQVHIGHDVLISNHCRIAPHATIGGEVYLKSNCNIGMNAVIHQRVTIPEGCMIGMGAVVTKKTELNAWSKYVGNPARYLSSNENFKK